jgi:transketolase
VDNLKLASTRTAYGETLRELGAINPDIVVLDADLSSSTQTGLFAQAFPERFFNIGIAEQNLVGTSAGLAAYGKIPYISTFAVFATGRAWEPIRQSLCIPRLPVKIVATHGGITVGPDGGSHQMTEDFSIMRSLPNMSVFCPADANETRTMIREVADYNEGPCYIRLSRVSFPLIYNENYKFIPGKSDMLADGNDLTIIAIGFMVHPALEAAAKLLKESIKARVINMSSLKPLDKEAVIKAARETGAILTIEEHQITGGLGSATAQLLAENYPTPMKIMGVKDIFGLSGESSELLIKHGLGTEDIIREAKELLRKK